MTDRIIQILTLVSVIAGLAVVVWEMRQTRELVRGELIADAISQINNQNIGFIGENVAQSLEKACNTPKSIDDADKIVLDYFYSLHVDRLRRLYLIERGTAADVAGNNWKIFAFGNFSVVFSTHYGRWWWQTIRYAEPEILELGDQILKELGAPDCQSFWDQYDSYISQVMGSEEVIRPE